MATNRSAETEKNYAIRAELLRKRAAKQFAIESTSSVPMTLVVDHLLSKKEGLSANTWRQYRSSLLFAIEQERSMTPEQAFQEELDEAERRLLSESSFGTKKKGSATSSKKLKGIRNDDFELIVQYLRNRIGTHRYASALLTWLQAGKLTGLRPCEWETVKIVLDDGKNLLRVQNAKHSNGRGNGEYRHLDLSELNQDELQSIQEMILMVDGFKTESDFQSLYTSVRSYLYTTARVALGKRAKYPTLYSLRHQFTANAKASELSRAENAALLGHASDATASLHYARKTQGRPGGVKVKARQSEVATVRNVHNDFNFADYKKTNNIK